MFLSDLCVRLLLPPRKAGRLFPLKTIFFLFALMFCSSAFGRIGETVEQLDRRYGKPFEINHEDNAEMRWYQFRDFIILVGMDQGISQCEVFRKVDNARLGESEIRALLEANVGTSPWREPEDNINNLVFTCKGKEGRIAIYTLRTHNLLITSKPFRKRFANLVISNEKRKMEGF